ncbi:MAG: 3-phosphoshikimate 1-carboxyvinyltransferase [Thermoleophilia bacterium]
MPDRPRDPSARSFLGPVGEGPVGFSPARTPLRGSVRVPGDKSVSHRAVLLGAVSSGPVSVTGFLRSADTLAGVAAVRALGVEVEEEGTKLLVDGSGWDGLQEPENVLDVGNSGTLIRLLPGLLASVPHLVVLTGDASIRRRPMSRITEPLRRMGVSIRGRGGGRFAPLVVQGGSIQAIEHRMEVSSAQVKSCLLLAGLRALGQTTVFDPGVSRDHTERMLRYGGVGVETEPVGPGQRVSVSPVQELRLGPIAVPGDPSSAAFLLAAGALVPGSEVTVTGVGLNPTRTGFLRILERMGVPLEIRDWPVKGPEPLGDVTVHGPEGLLPVDIGPEEVPGLIDELPIWALVAARAEGVSRLHGAGELRVKESDRLSGMSTLLRDIGVRVAETEDGLQIIGNSRRWPGGLVRSLADHRLAMVGAVAGLCSEEGVTVDDASCMAVSFPGFSSTIESLRTDEGEDS